MAEGAGGYKKPSKPSAVSGPGKYAKRTDGGINQPVRDMTGGGYGDNQELANLQGSAPMNASARTPQMPPQMPMRQGPPVPGFGDPTTRPNEPVTAGNPMGPGPGPGPQYTAQRVSEALRSIQGADIDGSLDDLIISLENAGL